LNRTHEEDFEALPLLPKTSNELFLDIGANRGAAIQSILMRRPDAKIVGFEPNWYLLSKAKNFYAHDRRVVIHNVGLGNAQGSYQLYIPFYNDYMFDGLASLVEKNAQDWLPTRIYGFRKEKLKIKKLLVEVRKLDDFKLKPYFIKIDVQGFEYEVLKGARMTIQEFKPTLLIETPGQEEISFLAALGYEPFIYKRSGFVKGTSGLNVFFLSEETRKAVSLM
jgi:methyltransferase, FkbM family